MINGVLIEPLKVISDERGSIMHMMRSDSPFFTNFGEIYFSTIKPGIIKGWKKHLKMAQHFAVPSGKVKLVIYDDREDSSTKNCVQEILLGKDNYQLVRVPPLVWYAFKALGDSCSLIANCTDMPHEPKEGLTLDPFDRKIPYSWE